MSDTDRRHVIPKLDGRLDELDFLKCVLILLVITFHLIYIGDGFPYAKQLVYTFHIPGFLLISGYLMNIGKPVRKFLKTLLWLVVPYVIMESGYVLAASMLPVRDHVSGLTPATFLYYLAVKPVGPYWYLQTMVICGALYYASFMVQKISTISRLLLFTLACAAVSAAGMMSMADAMYFIIGAAIRVSGLRFLDVVRASWLSLPLFAVLALSPSNFSRASAGGMAITYTALSIMLAVFPYVKGKARTVSLVLGRNSLALYIFSPIFTICCKVMVPWLSFDPTRMIYLILSLVVCVCGSLAICRLLDMLHLSRWIFGRKAFVP